MDKWNVTIGDAEIADPWQVQIGDASISDELLDPYSVEFGPIQDYAEYGDIGPIQDYQEYDGSGIDFGPAEVDPITFGEAEIIDPWSIGQASDYLEMGPAEIEEEGDFAIGNPDQQGSPYRVLVKR